MVIPTGAIWAGSEFCWGHRRDNRTASGYSHLSRVPTAFIICQSVLCFSSSMEVGRREIEPLRWVRPIIAGSA